MPDIKTRDTVKGTIKTLDKAAIAGERMKEAYVRTKEKAEHGVYSAESSPEEYAADRFSGGTETVTYEAAHQFDKQGRKGVQATRENISKAKEHFEQRKVGSEQPKAGAGQHSPNTEQHGAVMEQRKADLPKKQAREKAADRVRRRSADTARQSVKTADQEVQAIKTVERGDKTIKQSARSTGKATVKTTQKSIKTAQQTARTTIKTSQTTAKAAQKSAQAAAKASHRAAQAARAAAKATAAGIKAAAKATAAAVKAIIAATKALVAAIAAGGWIAVAVIVIICLIGLIVGCEICYEFLKEENGFVLQESILERLTDDIDFFVLCNPNNPTGLLVGQGLTDRILETCRKNNICLLADECFLDFVDEGEALSFKKKLISSDRVFLLKAFTKRYAMAGLRLGYGICPDRTLLDAMEFRVQPWNVSTPAQMAGIAALKEEQYVRQSMDLISKEKDYLRKELQDLGCLVYDSRANYLFFKGESDLGQKLLKEKIMIRDCSNYPGLSEGYYRIAVKLPDENRKLVETMKRVGCGNICER